MEKTTCFPPCPPEFSDPRHTVPIPGLYAQVKQPHLDGRVCDSHGLADLVRRGEGLLRVGGLDVRRYHRAAERQRPHVEAVEVGHSCLFRAKRGQGSIQGLAWETLSLSFVNHVMSADEDSCHSWCTQKQEEEQQVTVPQHQAGTTAMQWITQTATATATTTTTTRRSNRSTKTSRTKKA